MIAMNIAVIAWFHVVHHDLNINSFFAAQYRVQQVLGEEFNWIQVQISFLDCKESKQCPARRIR